MQELKTRFENLEYLAHSEEPTEVLSAIIEVLFATNHELTTILYKRYDVLKNILKNFHWCALIKCAQLGSPRASVCFEERT